MTGKDKVTVSEIYTFLKVNAIARVQIPGCTIELDDFADKFVKDASKRQQLLKETETFIEKIECEEVNKLLLQLAPIF